MSFTPAIPVYKPLRFLEGLRQAKVRLAKADLLDADSEVMGALNIEELSKLLEPPLERIVVNRKLRRFLPVLATHVKVPHASREKALVLALKRRKLLPAKTFLALYEEYYDRTLLKDYLESRYPAGQKFGMFSKEQLLAEHPAEKLQLYLFQDLNLSLEHLFSATKLRAEGRLAKEILSLQLEQPPLAWLRQLSERDLTGALFFLKDARSRFACFHRWLNILCGGRRIETRANLLAHPGASRLIDLFTTPQRLGSPFDAPLRWREADPDLLRVVQLYLYEKVIDEFFSSDNDGDRFQFWRNYADHCTGMRKFSRENAFAMKIGHLWFVEFVPTGACYIYSETNFQQIVSKPRPDLKQRTLCARESLMVEGASGLAQISPPLSHVHRGVGRSYTWQMQFREYIRKHAL